MPSNQNSEPLFLSHILAPSSKKYLVIVLFVYLLLVIVNFARAFYVFPPPAGDGPHWLVAIINNVNGLGFINQITDWGTSYTAQDGQFSLAGYPLLYPFVASLFSFGNDIRGVYIGLGLMKNLSLTFALLTYLAVLAKAKVCLTFGVSVLLISMLLTFNAFSGGSRPEILVVLIFSLVGFLIVVKGSLHYATMGFFLGLAGSTTPMAGLLSGIMLISLYSYWFDAKQAVKQLLVVGTISILVFLLALELRHGALESLQRLSYASGSQFGYWFDLRNYIWHNFLVREQLMLGFAIVFSILLMGLLPLLKPVRAVGLYYFGYTLFVLFYFAASVARPEPIYNIHALLPAGLLLTLWVYASGRLRVTTTLIYVLSSASFFVSLIGFIVYLQNGIGYDVARTQFNSVLANLENEERIGIDDGLWALSAEVRDYRRFYLWNSGIKNHAQDNSQSVLILKQMYGDKYTGNLVAPPQRILDPDNGIDHDLACDFFNHRLPVFMGFRYARTIPGYGFAVYVPKQIPRPAQSDKIGNSPCRQYSTR